MADPVGYGLPGWLDTERYLTAAETKAIGAALWASPDGRCPACEKRRATDKAHIARKGMGGTKQPGPMLGLCRECHTGPGGLDRADDWCVAIRRRDLMPCIVGRDGSERPLVSVHRVN